jgi:competence ComEA-like helix-hairpin-helix protein
MWMTVTEQDSAGAVQRVEPAGEALSKGDEGWGWTAGQRVGLGILVLLLIGFLGLQWWRRPGVIGVGSVVVDGGAAGLPRRVNPNVATEKELARIPHVGEKMAAKIVAFREQHREAEGMVFRRVEDLGRVDGVGKGTVELLRPYMEIGAGRAEQEDATGSDAPAGGNGG